MELTRIKAKGGGLYPFVFFSGGQPGKKGESLEGSREVGGGELIMHVVVRDRRGGGEALPRPRMGVPECSIIAQGESSRGNGGGGYAM